MRGRQSVLLVLLIVLVLIALVSVGWWLRTATERRLSEIALAIEQQQYDRAEQMLAAHLAVRPQDGVARLLMARVSRCKVPDDLEQARQHLAVARQVLGPMEELELEEAMLLCQSGWRGRETEANLAGLVDSPQTLGPVRRMIYEALVRGHIRAGRLNAAVRWLDRWIRALPGQADAHRWRACVLQYQQRAHLAQDDYRVLLAMYPDDRTLQIELGIVLAESGYDYHEAIQLLQDAGNQEQNVRALTAKAISYYGLGDLATANTILHQALHSDPRHLPAWMWKARIALDCGQHESALRAIRHAMAMLPAISSRRAKLALLERRVPPVAQPSTYLERLAELEIQALRAAGTSAELDHALERYRQLKERFAEWNQLVEATPGQPDLHQLYQAARLQLELADCDEAESLVQRLLEQAPDYPAAIDLLHECHQKRYRAEQEAMNPPADGETSGG